MYTMQGIDETVECYMVRTVRHVLKTKKVTYVYILPLYEKTYLLTNSYLRYIVVTSCRLSGTCTSDVGQLWSTEQDACLLLPALQMETVLASHTCLTLWQLCRPNSHISGTRPDSPM